MSKRVLINSLFNMYNNSKRQKKGNFSNGNFVYVKKNKTYYPGTIKRKYNNRYNVKYDNNSDELTLSDNIGLHNSNLLHRENGNKKIKQNFNIGQIVYAKTMLDPDSFSIPFKSHKGFYRGKIISWDIKTNTYAINFDNYFGNNPENTIDYNVPNGNIITRIEYEIKRRKSIKKWPKLKVSKKNKKYYRDLPLSFIRNQIAGNNTIMLVTTLHASITDKTRFIDLKTFENLELLQIVRLGNIGSTTCLPQYVNTNIYRRIRKKMIDLFDDLTKKIYNFFNICDESLNLEYKDIVSAKQHFGNIIDNTQGNNNKFNYIVQYDGDYINRSYIYHKHTTSDRTKIIDKEFAIKLNDTNEPIEYQTLLIPFLTENGLIVPNIREEEISKYDINRILKDDLESPEYKIFNISDLIRDLTENLGIKRIFLYDLSCNAVFQNSPNFIRSKGYLKTFNPQSVPTNPAPTELVININ